MPQALLPLAPCDCCTITTNDGLKQHELTVLGVRSDMDLTALKCRCEQGWFLLEAPGSPSVPFAASRDHCIPWLVAPSSTFETCSAASSLFSCLRPQIRTLGDTGPIWKTQDSLPPQDPWHMITCQVPFVKLAFTGSRGEMWPPVGTCSEGPKRLAPQPRWGSLPQQVGSFPG